MTTDFVFKNIFSRSLRSLFLHITIPSGRDIEAHRGFSVIWSSRNPSPQKCYVCVCVIIDLSSPILNYESPSKRRLFQIHACDMNRWYIVTRDVKISIFSPRRSKKILLPVAVLFFLTLQCHDARCFFSSGKVRVIVGGKGVCYNQLDSPRHFFAG